MQTLQKINGRVLAIFLIAFLISAFLPALAQASSPYQPEELIKGSADTVYYIGQDNMRYVFPNQKVYMSWYENFDAVRTIDDADVNAASIAGVVRYRPGVRMIKVPDDPKVYTVSAQGLVRHVKDEDIAKALYGTAWNTHIDDMLASLFVSNYSFGAEISDASQYDPAAQTAAATTISADFGLIDTTTESSEPSGDDQSSGDEEDQETSDPEPDPDPIAVPTLYKDIEAFAYAPSDAQKVYAVSSDSNVGIIISSNGGTTWTTSRDGLSATAVAVNHDDSDTALAIENGVIIRTTDGGLNWDESTVPTDFSDALGMDFSMTNSDVAYAVSASILIKSVDGGINWERVNVVNANTYEYTGAMEVSHTNSDLLLVGSSKGIQRTINGGINWTQYKPGQGEMLPVRSIALNQKNTSVFYMVTDEGIWYTADTGNSWNVTKAPDVVHADVHNIALAPSDTNILYITTESGVFVSSDRAVTWEPKTSGMVLADSHALAISPEDANTLLAGTDDQAEDNGNEGIYSSENGGEEWVIVGALIF